MESHDDTTRARLEVLAVEETFIRFAGHLKALHLRMADRERHHKARRRGLLEQIRVFETECLELASRSPRVAEMWSDVKRELEQFDHEVNPG